MAAAGLSSRLGVFSLFRRPPLLLVIFPRGLHASRAVFAHSVTDVLPKTGYWWTPAPFPPFKICCQFPCYACQKLGRFLFFPAPPPGREVSFYSRFLFPDLRPPPFVLGRIFSFSRLPPPFGVRHFTFWREGSPGRILYSRTFSFANST